MTKPNEAYAYFTISGEFDPDEITEEVGLSPTECWMKGDINPSTQRERKWSRWSIYSRLRRSFEIELHIADVLQQLDAKKPEFIKIAARYGGQMQLVAYFHAYYPGLHFEPALIQSLAEYGLGVDFDFYYLYSHIREDSE